MVKMDSYTQNPLFPLGKTLNVNCAASKILFKKICLLDSPFVREHRCFVTWHAYTVLASCAKVSDLTAIVLPGMRTQFSQAVPKYPISQLHLSGSMQVPWGPQPCRLLQTGIRQPGPSHPAAGQTEVTFKGTFAQA